MRRLLLRSNAPANLAPSTLYRMRGLWPGGIKSTPACAYLAGTLTLDFSQVGDPTAIPHSSWRCRESETYEPVLVILFCPVYISRP